MNTSWTLLYQGQQRTLADWGLERLVRRRVNQGLDTVVMHQVPRPQDPPDAFQLEAPITLYCNGTPWFHGLITDTPALAHALGQERHYTVSGPWWYLENLVYQQAWPQAQLDFPLGATPADAQTYLTGEEETVGAPARGFIQKSRVILGQDAHGNRLPTGEQLRAILDYAIEAGAPFQIGTIGLNCPFPFDEVKDMTCAQLIRRLLRWHPDALCWFDYHTPGLPTFHACSWNQLPRVQLSLAQGFTTVALAKRQDRVVPGVVIKYERTHRMGAECVRSTQVEAYPQQATGAAFKSVVLTIELDGSRAQVRTAQLKTAPIAAEKASWWQAKLPALKGIPLDKIRVEGTQWLEGSAPFANELLEGHIEPWMGVPYKVGWLMGWLSWEGPQETVVRRPIALQLTTTPSASRTFRQPILMEAQEEMPEGLARSLYESLSPVHYQGHLTRVEPECSGEVNLGQRLDLVGAEAEWAHMGALVQEIQETVQTGTTRIVVGPPGHLGTADLVELLRVNRGRNASAHASERTASFLQAPADSVSALQAPVQQVQMGAGGYERFELQKPLGEASPALQRIELNLSDFPKDQTLHVKLREIRVCEGGQERKMLVLGSEIYG